MKKKILFFMFSLVGGGAERTVVNIMNNIDREQFEVILVLGQRKKDDYVNLVSKDIKILHLNARRVRYCILKLRKTIIEEEPEYTFSTLNPNNISLILANVLAFNKRSKCIIREANNRTESGKVTWINKKLTRFFYNRYSYKIVALSEGVKNDLTNNFEIIESKIEMIYNPVEICEIKQKSNEEISDVKFTNNEKIIISVGRLVEQKNFPLLLNSFKIVKKYINAKILILGIGPLEHELKKMAKGIGVSEYITFLGFKENPYKYMKKADVFVLQSNWEGFGHVIVEAMACATPVVSTDCKSGPREIIGDNEFGLLTPVNDVDKLAKNIIEILTNERLSRRYVDKGHKRSLDFEASKITKQYQKLFN